MASTGASQPHVHGMGKERIAAMKKAVDLLVNPEHAEDGQREMLRMRRMLEETLTKNMHLQKDLEQ